MASETLIWATTEQADELDKALSSLEAIIITLKESCVKGTDEWFRSELTFLDLQDSRCTDIRSKVHSLRNSCELFTEKIIAQISNPKYGDFSGHSQEQQALICGINDALAQVTIEVNASTLRVQDPEKHRFQLEHDALVVQYSHLIKERDVLNQMGWRIEQERATLRTEIDKLRSDQKRFSQEALDARVTAAGLQEECKKLQDEYNKLTVDNKALVNKAMSLEHEVSKDLDQFRQKLTSDYNHAKKGLEEESAMVKQALENLKIENRRLESKIQSKEVELAGLKSRNQTLTLSNQNLQIAVDHEASRIHQLDSDKGQLSVELANVRSIKERQESQITELEIDNRTLQSRFSRIHNELKALKEREKLMRVDFTTVVNAAGRWMSDPSTFSTPNKDSDCERRRSGAPGSAHSRVQSRDEDDGDRPTAAVGSRADPNENRPGYHQVRGHWAKNPTRQG